MEEKRVYPNDQLVSDVIGFVGMDEGWLDWSINLINF